MKKKRAWKIAALHNLGAVSGAPRDNEAPDFRRELAALLNRHSKENHGGDTPDFILADLLSRMLSAVGETIHKRDQWYGRTPPAAPPSGTPRDGWWTTKGPEVMTLLKRILPPQDFDELTESEWNVALRLYAALSPPAAPAPTPSSRPRIVCLCGSSRFIAETAVVAWELEKEGNIVLAMHLLPQWYTKEASHQAEAEGIAAQMDALHLKKIDMADRVMVVNVGGYYGESTAREVEYARSHGKHVTFLVDNPRAATPPELQQSAPAREATDALREDTLLLVDMVAELHPPHNYDLWRKRITENANRLAALGASAPTNSPEQK